MSFLKVPAPVANSGPKNSVKNDVIVDSSTDSEHNETSVVEASAFQEDNEIPTFAVRMLNMSREFTIFCVIMITYAALTKDPPKLTKSPPAYPFFPPESIVTDWYRGQISKGIENAISSDVAFVMYYAPWDAQSQAARREFELAANHMRNYVTFLAVNCWQPHSECRTQYSKVYRWPVLIAYPSHGKGVQYSGPLSSPHIIKFLRRVCNPISRFDERKQVEFEDAYVVATVSTSPGNRDFSAFYIAALKYLERDPQHRVSFHVKSMAVTEPSLTLHLWNETLSFPIMDLEWRPDTILQWIFKNSHQVTAWVLPTGAKSYEFHNSMQNGPALILFTPRNPLHFSSDYYNMLQEIGQEYYNCDDNLLVDMHSVNIKSKRSANLLQYSKFKAACKPKSNPTTTRKIVSHFNPVWTNTSSCLQKERSSVDCKSPSAEKLRHICSQILNDYEAAPAEDRGEVYGNAYSTFNGVYVTSMLTGYKDRRSPENLLKSSQRETYKHFCMAEKLSPAVFESPVDHATEQSSVRGMSCITNTSLTLLAMDSMLHYHFAERFGVDLTKRPDGSAAVIVNLKMESHYVLEGPVNGYSLREFVSNFTKNQLSRSFESISTVRLKDSGLTTAKNDNHSKVVIRELHTSTFIATVLEEDKDVVVLYYTKQCAFCSGVSYVFLNVARKLKYLPNLIFTRVDGDLNILPWEYTMESFPTVLFFPADRKSESRAFPPSIPITVPNLIGFILTNLHRNVKLQAMWSICTQIKVKEGRTSCFLSLRGETLGQIDRTLSDWRKSNKRQRQVILHKLKQLRQLHLLFAHFPHKYQTIVSFFKKLNFRVNSVEDYHSLRGKINAKDEL